MKADVLHQQLILLAAVVKVAEVRRLIRPRSMETLLDLVALVHEEVAAGAREVARQ